MIIPPYFKQEGTYTCSLAVLRMVLATKDIIVEEKELFEKIQKEYGDDFKNIWNPTIARLAAECGVPTLFYAKWPLFRRELLSQAQKEYRKNPNTFVSNKYEKKRDVDVIAIPLPLSYKEMFLALEKGCRVMYGSITKRRIHYFLSQGKLIQVSIRIDTLYPGKRRAFHSLLVYGYKNNTIYFHDPAYGASLTCSFSQLQSALLDVGAGIIYG